MPILHVQKLRGKGGQEEYEITEEAPLPAWSAETKLATVGHRHPRVEGAEKVTGRARYTYDIRLPGQLYARILRSPHPHARVVRIDTSRAAALAGVRAILSRKNARDFDWYKESKLFNDSLRVVGDEVAAVAADSEEIAEDALRLIEVEYEPLPFVANLAQAMHPKAPKLYPDGNVSDEKQYQRGDTDAGFAEAAIITEATYTTQTNLHNCFEPHGTTAMWEGERLTLWDSTQSIFEVREQAAQKLQLPELHVRVNSQ